VALEELMKEAVKLLEDITMREPGPLTLAAIIPMQRQRTLTMTYLRVIDGQCAWCNKVPLLSKRKKYCDSDCKNSAFFYCYPQSPSSKMWVFINRQNCACPLCGECFDDELAAKILLTRKRWDEGVKNGYKWMAGKVSYHSIGDNTGDQWQVDHIIPLHRGGDGIGLNNIQVVCKACHQRKTTSERVY